MREVILADGENVTPTNWSGSGPDGFHSPTACYPYTSGYLTLGLGAELNTTGGKPVDHHQRRGRRP